MDEIAAELKKYHKDVAAVTLAARASRGNLGLAERILADAGFADTYASAKKILALATGSRMFAKTAAVYEKFTREKTDAVLGVMEYLLCDVARSLVGAETVFDSADVKPLRSGSRRIPRRKARSTCARRGGTIPPTACRPRSWTR